MNREQAKAQADALLRAVGFRDIEGSNGAITDDRHGREPDPTAADYYDDAAAQLVRFPWRSAAHREVWWRHCQGERSRAIARAMGLHRNTVNNVIASVRAVMQARARLHTGRPEDPLGHGVHSRAHYVRLNEREENAAERVCKRWGVGFAQAVRNLFVAVDAVECAVSDIRKLKK